MLALTKDIRKNDKQSYNIFLNNISYIVYDNENRLTLQTTIKFPLKEKN